MIDLFKTFFSINVKPGAPLAGALLVALIEFAGNLAIWMLVVWLMFNAASAGWHAAL